MKPTWAIALIVVILSVAILTSHRAAAADRPAISAAEASAVQPDLCFGFGSASSPYNTGGGATSFPCNSTCLLFQGSNDIRYYGNVCPGPPAAVVIDPAPASLTCASTSNIAASVVDKDNNAVADDTAVTFATDLGTITGSGATTAGRVVASVSMPVKTVGEAHITVTVGNVTARKTINVTC